MSRASFAAVSLLLACFVLALAPAASASHPSCNLLTPTTTTTNPVTVAVPVPSVVGPFTVGPATVPPVASVSGLPVVGTVTVGGQSVGPVTVPGTPTGLNPISVTVFGQSFTTPGNAPCVLGTTSHTLEIVGQTVQDVLDRLP